ncbi:MAG: SET domain-containing protein [Betaproteobacteria bacterium]|jgi:SET domain-containing protein|nr:SET domain-containing protein [Betaproteobacteria bacterium]
MLKTKKALLQHLQEEVYCHLGVSKIAGIGVFALRRIPKGINPLRSWLPTKELAITLDELNKLPTPVRKHIHMFCYVDNKKKKVEVPVYGMNSANMSVYLNHSKKPSLKFTKVGELVSLRQIDAGEELTIDYDKSFGEKHVFK